MVKEIAPLEIMEMPTLAKPRGSHWILTSSLVVSDVIGSGVLALPSAVAALGWVPGMSLLVVFGYMSLYTGLLLGRLHCRYPNVHSYGDLAHVFAGERGRKVAAFFANLQMFGLVAVFLLAMELFTRQTLEALGRSSACFPVVVGAISLVCLLPAQLRTMEGVGKLSVPAFVALYASLACFLLALFGGSTGIAVFDALRGGRTRAFGANFVRFVLGASNMVLTFSGHVMYLELIADMQEPKIWPRALKM